MLENLISIESLVAISVAATFSFKIGRVNLNIKNNIRNQSPDIHGSNNLVIYNQAMAGIKKEMAFSVKVCAFLMIIMFHIFPIFFVNLLLSFSLLLPLFNVFGVINSIRLNGGSRGWDILYPMASIVMGVLFYCSVNMMVNYIDLYPQLTILYQHISEYRLMGMFDAPQLFHKFFLIILSSIAYPALIISGFYLTFAYTTTRNGNDAFKYSMFLLLIGYVAYLFLSGCMFSNSQGNVEYFVSVLTYPFVSLLSLFSL